MIDDEKGPSREVESAPEREAQRAGRPIEEADAGPQIEDRRAQQLESEADPKDPSRRSFIQAAIGTVVTTAALAGSGYELIQITRPAGEVGREVGGGEEGKARPVHWAEIDLKVNGAEPHLTVPHQRTLLLALREDLGLTGTKKSCNLGQCGACTVLMDGLPVYSCLLLAMDVEGREILTVEGLESQGALHPVQEGFIRQMGSQCGACTSGMIMSAVGLLRQNPTPTVDQVKEALAGVLCRCGNYPHEIASVLAAAELAAAKSAANRPQPEVPETAGQPDGSKVAAGVDGGAAFFQSEPGPATGPPFNSFNSTIKTLDAHDKATGRARYAGDLGFHSDDEFKSPLYAKVVRSPFPHADLADIDDSRARRLPGYKGMVTWRDVPGYQPGRKEPGLGDRSFLNDKARYVGDAVAAIAADDQYTAQEALALVKVSYRRLTPYPDAEKNLAERVEAIHPGTVAGFGGPQPADHPTVEFKTGDVDRGFKEADLVVEGRYVTPIQCHVPIETHCCTAYWEGGRLTVWDSQQSVHNAREVLSAVLQIPAAQIRVSCKYLGGGFGGKCTDSTGKTLYQAIAALLSRKTGRPVRLEYTLKEEMFAEDTRNPFVFYLRTGVKRDGAITALECKAIQRTGGYASSGPAVVSVAGEGIIDTYRVENYWYRGYSVYTNSPVGGEMRGFGHPQAVFARETHMDKVANAIGMNPLEFRLKNTLRKGDRITLGVARDIPLAGVGAVECLRLGAEAIGWHRWQHHSEKTGRIRRGLGLRHSQEHTGRNSSDGLVWMDPGGKIHVPLGIGNLGTEAHTGVALIVAEALGVPVSELDVTWADSSDTAWDFVTDASRSVHCHGKAMYNAALDLKNKLHGHAARKMGVPGENLRSSGGRVHDISSGQSMDHKAIAAEKERAEAGPPEELVPYYDPKLDVNPLLDETTGQIAEHPTPKLSPATLALARRVIEQGGIVGLGYYIYNPSVQSWGASFAEVEVDMETGQVRVLKLVGAHDVGRVIHRPGAEAQIQGGGVMGLGYALTEELLTDPATGIPVNPSLYEYRPLSILDVPELAPILVEAPVEAGPYGAKGLGENPMFDAGAAVANAVFNATGLGVEEIPMTWPRMYDQLKKNKMLI